MAMTATRPQGRRPQQARESSRWDPLAELQFQQSQLSSLLENWGDLSSMMAEGFTPKADVEETEDAYLVEVELPGVKKGDIEISVSGRRIAISGERKEKERVGILRRRTRSVGRFYYEVLLPAVIDESDVTAHLDDGELIVRVPKATNERSRRIQVH
jgi:HSP20 family protein